MCYNKVTMKNKLAYYRILNLSPTATLDEIKTAYRKLAKRYHPDVNPESEVAEEKFKEIAEAYQSLTDSKLQQIQYPQYTSTKTTPTQESYSFERKATFNDFAVYPTTSSRDIFLEIFLTINLYLSIIILLLAPFLPGAGNNEVYSLSGACLILFLFCISQGYLLTGWFWGLMALFGWLPVTFGECSWKVGIFASAALIGAILAAVITGILFFCFKLKIAKEWS